MISDKEIVITKEFYEHGKSSATVMTGVSDEMLHLDDADELEEEGPDYVIEPYRTAYFVIGPESSGTKLVTKLLMNAGCFGSDEHQQPIDEALDNDTFFDRLFQGEEKIVVRRSWPHGIDHKAPDVKGIFETLESKGYEVRFVVTMRSWPTMIESQIDAEQHASTRWEAYENIVDATTKIFYWIKRLKAPFIIVNYGDLLRNKTVTLHWMLNALGLEYERGMEGIIDGEKESVRVRDYRSGVGV